MDPMRTEAKIVLQEGVPVSLHYDDVYFSKEGGWEESKYVFLEGNCIPEAFSKKEISQIQIGELGFGTGLNFFVTLDHWQRINDPASVQFVSLEGFPLPSEILHSLNLSFPGKPLWTEALQESYTEQRKRWNLDANDMIWKVQIPHQKSPNPQTTFTLTLYLGDVLECLELFPKIDFWYLDGFSPNKNPNMWSPETLSQIRIHSKKGTRFSTFTAAGFIRRNLESLGFFVQKQKGFGKKREMLTGVLL
jgi:tRNA 5-methylaminomethyl-2-thiouridine biosynthesis bifunctional protein